MNMSTSEYILSTKRNSHESIDLGGVPLEFHVTILESGFEYLLPTLYRKQLEGSIINLSVINGSATASQYTEPNEDFAPMVIELFKIMTVDDIGELKHLLKHPFIESIPCVRGDMCS